MLTIITGPMFAGKTTALIEALSSFSPEEVLVIKPKFDTRYQEQAIASHDGESLPAIVVDQVSPDIVSLVTTDTKVVAIDELNFFSFETLLPEIQSLLEMKIDVIGAGLSHDFVRKPFGPVLELMRVADRIERRTAKCDKCGNEAAHSYRKKKLDTYLAIGGAELYGASCDECWEQLAQ